MTDVAVYGTTAAGVMSAVGAARDGASVVLLEPGRHVAGMATGGLGRADVERQEALLGGLVLEFARRLRVYRVCLTTSGDRIPVPPPPGYDRDRFEVVAGPAPPAPGWAEVADGWIDVVD